jgi:hypothetical protein
MAAAGEGRTAGAGSRHASCCQVGLLPVGHRFGRCMGWPGMSGRGLRRRPGPMRRGVMADGAMGLGQTGFGCLCAVQRVRCVQRRSANAGTTQSQDRDQSKCPKTGETHPASILSPLGVSCRASPLGAAHFMPFLERLSNAGILANPVQNGHFLMKRPLARTCFGLLQSVHHSYRPLRTQRTIFVADGANFLPDAPAGQA